MALSTRIRFNKNNVINLNLEAHGQWVTDTEVPQLVIRITPTSKTYVARWTSKTGKRMQTTIAPVASISVDTARDEARKLVVKDERGGVETLADVYRVWEESYASTTTLANQADFRSAWKNHIEPHFGRTQLARLKHADLQKWYRAKRQEKPRNKDGVERAEPYSAATVNRWLAYISKLCTIARVSEWMTGDPTEKLQTDANAVRIGVLTKDHRNILADLFKVEEKTAPQAVAALRFMMLYPCRGKEAREMRWSDVDLVAGTWTIPAARYKTREAKEFALSPVLVDYLRRLPRWSETYVFPSPTDPTSPIRREHVNDVWNRVRPLPVGAHILRKTIATGLLNRDVPLEAVSRILGHSSTAVTQKAYAHLSAAKMVQHLSVWASVLEEDQQPPGTAEERQVLADGAELIRRAEGR